MKNDVDKQDIDVIPIVKKAKTAVSVAEFKLEITQIINIALAIYFDFDGASDIFSDETRRAYQNAATIIPEISRR